MWQVIREVKSCGSLPVSVPVEYTNDNNFFYVLDVAKDLADGHSADIQGEKPIRFHNGFTFWTNNESVVTYRVEKV